VDLWQLQEAIESGNAVKVLELYTPPFAPELDLGLISDFRYSLNQDVIDLLFEAALDDTNPSYLERILELDPGHEEALQLLLRSLLQRGRQREAKRRYKAFAEFLEMQMGLEPLPETKRLLAI
jgi:DNA-binding SARP family transcriptional activator